MKAIKKLIDVIAGWLFKPKAKQTYSCRDVATDEQEKDKRGQHE